jgi:hypothetical protein
MPRALPVAHVIRKTAGKRTSTAACHNNRDHRAGGFMRSAVRTFVIGCLLTGSTAVVAQQYPAKPVRVIVPFPPGNTADILGRLIGEKFTKRYGQQMIVDNRPGAAGEVRKAREGHRVQTAVT